MTMAPPRSPPSRRHPLLLMKNLIRCSVLTLCTLLFGVACGKKSDQGAPTAPESANSSAAAATGTAQPTSGRVVEITANDTMKFSVSEIRAKPGEALAVKLTNVGQAPKFSMGHNWVLLKIGTNLDTFASDAMNAAATNYVPAEHKDWILAHTKLLGPKESDTALFHAPATPGRYPFLCTFPGHFQVGMKGELIVE